MANNIKVVHAQSHKVGKIFGGHINAIANILFKSLQQILETNLAVFNGIIAFIVGVKHGTPKDRRKTVQANFFCLVQNNKLGMLFPIGSQKSSGYIDGSYHDSLLWSRK